MTHHCPTCHALCGCTGHSAEIGPEPPACLCCTTCVNCGELHAQCRCAALVDWIPPEPEPTPAGVCPVCGDPHMVGRALSVHMTRAHGSKGLSHDKKWKEP